MIFSLIRLSYDAFYRAQKLTTNLPVIEVAFIHSDLPAKGPGGHVALKECLHFGLNVSIVSIRFLIYEPQRYSGGVMRKRRSLPNDYDYPTSNIK